VATCITVSGELLKNRRGTGLNKYENNIIPINMVLIKIWGMAHLLFIDPCRFRMTLYSINRIINHPVNLIAIGMGETT